MRRKLFDHRVKLLPLFRCQFRPDALMDPFHLLVPDFAVSLLAFGDDFRNRRMLFGCQLERLIEVSNEIFPPRFR